MCLPAHRGAMVMTLCPRFASSTGSPPTTSPRPPAEMQGREVSAIVQ